MKRRKRVKGRFYIFLVLLLAAAFFIIRPYLNFGGGEAVIMTANSEYSQMMDCVIIRSESVVTSESPVRIEFLAKENTLVESGSTVAYVYSAGYSEKLLAQLETTRTKIQEYHRTVVLKNIKDNNLERFDTIVDMMTDQFKQLVRRKTAGSLLTVSTQLETAMVNRQEYLRQNKRDDTKLTKLYDEENTRMTSIQSWRSVEKATRQGVVSFYSDGYERDLQPETISQLTPSDIRTILAGGKLSTDNSSSSVIYRLVDQNKWYVALVANSTSWNPVVGQEYFLQLEGFEDLSYSASVTRVQKENDTVLVVFEITDPVGPLIYQRTGKAMMSITLSGLSVSAKAIVSQNGQTGVLLYDVPGGTFVPVEVLSTDGTTSLIQPLVDGALSVGQRVLYK